MAKDIGILFTGDMVRAILEGRKTQTRRVAKFRGRETESMEHGFGPSSQYGAAGGGLWVRETFFAWGHWRKRFSEKKGREEWHFVDDTLGSGRQYRYAADGAPAGYSKGKRTDTMSQWWKRPAIHMPRIASRLLLGIAETHIEQLNGISEGDAIAEGTTPSIVGSDLEYMKYRAGYQTLWESINGPGSWEENPWVVVIDFKVIKGEGNARTV